MWRTFGVVIWFLAATMMTVESTSVAAVPANSPVCVSVPGGIAGDVAVINITNTQANGRGYGALRASDATPIYNRPTANQYSSVNFANDTPPNPNLAVAKIGSDGKVCYDGAVNTHNVILDLAATLPATAINALDPTRILDTRTTTPVNANTSRCVSVPGGIAGDVAVINITNTQANGRGYGALRASDATPIYNRPTANQYSSVNFANDTPPNPNLAVAKIGSDGKVCYDGAVNTHNVILDLAATLPATAINALDPTRILDTRTTTPGSVTESQVLNQTLPQGTCADIGERTGLRLRNGEARSNLPFGGAITVRANTVDGVLLLADFNGDGLEDAAYLVNCWGGGNSEYQEVFIHLAGKAPQRFTPRELFTTSQMTTPGWVSGTGDLAWTGSRVTVEWFGNSGSDSTCCPSLKYRTLFRTTPSVAISAVEELNPATDAVVGAGDPRCSERLMGSDVGGVLLIDEQLCELGWAYVSFCFDGECGVGDSQAILRHLGGRWTVYTNFPNFTLCESTVRAAGMPTRIVNRVNWAC